MDNSKYYFVLMLVLSILVGCASKPFPKKTYMGYEGQPLPQENIAVLVWEGFFDCHCRANGRYTRSQYVKQIDDIDIANLYSFCGGSIDTCCGTQGRCGAHDYDVELLPGIHQIKYFADFGDRKFWKNPPRIITINLDMKAGHTYKIDNKSCDMLGGGDKVIVIVIDETIGDVICSEQLYSSCGDIQQSNCTMHTGVFVYEVLSEDYKLHLYISSFSELDVGDCIKVVSNNPEDEALKSGKIISKSHHRDRLQHSDSVVMHYPDEPTDFSYSVWDEPVKLLRSICP